MEISSITSITEGSPSARNPFKSTMKINIDERISITKEGSTSLVSPKRTTLIFRDSDKIGGILNENFPLVIKAITSNFDVSKVLTDGGS